MTDTLEKLVMAQQEIANLRRQLQDEHVLAKEMHEQVWVKVNVQVDRGVAEAVSTLGRIAGLQTLESCEGTERDPAYIYFTFGDWRTLGAFLFEELGPCLWKRLGDSATISVEMFNGSAPMGKLSFDKEATSIVASTLAELPQDRP